MVSARKNLFGRGGREGEREEEDAITINDHTVRKCAFSKGWQCFQIEVLV
jgi:hypothetical protein